MSEKKVESKIKIEYEYERYYSLSVKDLPIPPATEGMWDFRGHIYRTNKTINLVRWPYVLEITPSNEEEPREGTAICFHNSDLLYTFVGLFENYLPKSGKI